MERDFFSLLWDKEEYYKEWRRDISVKDGEYIFDLNLEYIYEEMCRWSGFGDRYSFREIFLHSCTRSSTIGYRQRIMERLFADTELYGIVLGVVSCIFDAEKKLKRIFGTKDELKKEIFFLQMFHEFLTFMGESYVRLEEQVLIVPGTQVAVGVGRLGEEVAGEKAKQQKSRLEGYLSMLCQSAPSGIMLNKNENQRCHSVVPCHSERACSMKESQPLFMDRLKMAVSLFLDDYEYSVKVYQNTDISCLDKKIQEHACSWEPRLLQGTKELYEACIGFDFQPFFRLAEELAFYLSCICFRKRYEQQGFYFVMPLCRHGVDTKVEGAYDMVLGVNLFQKDAGHLMISNNFRFDDKGRMFLLTGANQGGKTTFLRSVGLVQHLAQIGMYVPAREAVIGLVGHIHTHFSRNDEEAAVVGRFEQELERMRKMLECLEGGDMVLLNEAFTSTQRMGAVALLCRLLQELCRRHCVGGLVTHYHEITDMLEEDYFYSLAAEVGHTGRTFKIIRTQPYRQSYAKDIALKCGVTYEQLIQVIETSGESGDGDVLF